MDYEENQLNLIIQALGYAAEKHRNQRRKDSLSSPYINHPIDVLGLLWSTGNIRDVEILSAAILHDTVEDTGANPEEITELFGRKVCELVIEVTDDKSLPSPVRKQLQIKHASQLSHGAKQIKLADKISNVRDLVHLPPVDWTLDRKVDYLDWCGKVVAGLRGANPALEELFDAVSQEGYKLLADEKTIS